MTNIPESQAERIVRKFGGRQPMSEKTGLKDHVIRHAERVGYFQEGDRPLILAKAELHHLDVTAFDFIAHLVQRRDEPLAAAG